MPARTFPTNAFQLQGLFMAAVPPCLSFRILSVAASGLVPPLGKVLPGEIHHECGADASQPPHDFRHEGDRNDGLVPFHPLKGDPGAAFR